MRPLSPTACLRCGVWLVDNKGTLSDTDPTVTESPAHYRRTRCSLVIDGVRWRCLALGCGAEGVVEGDTVIDSDGDRVALDVSMLRRWQPSWCRVGTPCRFDEQRRRKAVGIE